MTSLVLISGFMLDETLWDEFTPYLPNQWHVLQFSLANGNRIEDIAKNIAENSPEKFVLVGFSLGGYVARKLASDYPEKVSALVIIASSLREDTPEQFKSKQQVIDTLSSETFKGLSTKSIAQSLHPKNASNMDLINHIKDMGNHLGYEAFVTQSNLSRVNLQTNSINCPTLVIASSHDKLRSVEESNEIFKSIPNASLQIFEESGHMIPLEQPKELAEAIINWLKT